MIFSDPLHKDAHDQLDCVAEDCRNVSLMINLRLLDGSLVLLKYCSVNMLLVPFT